MVDWLFGRTTVVNDAARGIGDAACLASEESRCAAEAPTLVDGGASAM